MYLVKAKLKCHPVLAQGRKRRRGVPQPRRQRDRRRREGVRGRPEESHVAGRRRPIGRGQRGGRGCHQGGRQRQIPAAARSSGDQDVS